MNRPIVIGSDTEIGNFVLGAQSKNGTGQTASRALLRAIDGFSSSASGSTSGQCNCAHCQERRKAESESAHSFSAEGSKSSGYNSQDWGRKYLASNGGCVYIDLDHLELCTPETTSAFDYTAAWHAMLVTARAAQTAVNEKAPDGMKVQCLVNNSDGLGNSYGGHLSFCVSRRLWDNIFHRKVHYSLFLAAHQVSSIVYTGGGKAGAENKRPAVPYQIAQRADFFETLTALQTTYRRPIVNSRDETLCGRQHSSWLSSSDSKEDGDGLARLHVIFYDASLSHAACVLKAGTMQIILAMLEAGTLNPSLILDDPLEAVVAYSHDPGLDAKALMASGERLTAVELQWKFFEAAKRFHDAGGCEGRVPRAGEILELWGDTLQKLEHKNFDALGRRLDWVLKWHAINRAMSRRPELTWDSPEIKHLDHLYCSLDTADGLYWAYQKAGVLETWVTPAEIERFVHEPPDDTRAWTRARLMRLAGSERTDNIDWDTMRFKVSGSRGWPSYPSLELADPLGWSKSETEQVFTEGAPLEDVLTSLKELAESKDETSRASAPSNGGQKLLAGPTSKKKKSMWSSWTN